MYGSQKDIRHNLTMFVIDGISFMPSMAIISITAVIPFFLDQLGATTFQIALATALTSVCAFLSQPLFGVLASRSTVMNRTFGKILLLQRFIFLGFILLIPVFSNQHSVLVNLFLVFWAVFNIFVGSYTMFHTPLVLKLLPPEKRGAIRGVGQAVGSFIGVGVSALLPLILYNIAFPYNFMVAFLLGFVFLLANACVFFFMRQSKDVVQNEAMGMLQYIKEMPATIKGNASFRAMLIVLIFLAIANSVIPYYTLYAIREFSATESHIATLAGMAILFGAIAHVSFGFIADRLGARVLVAIVACFVIAAGAIMLIFRSLNFLFVAWVLANMATNGYILSAMLLLGEVSPPTKLPLYVGVQTITTMALSAVVVMLVAPALENIGFVSLFVLVFVCGLLSLLANVFLLGRRMKPLDGA